MWKRVLLFILLAVVVAAGGGLGYLTLKKPAQRPALTIKIDPTPARVERGKYIFTKLADCDGCHSQRDFTRVAGPVIESGRGRGNILSDFVTDLPGTVVAPNITPDPETGIGTWTDGEKMRAIREGVDRDGRALFPMMPYSFYRNMSNEDVMSVVAYLDSLPSVKNRLPQTSLKFPVGLMIKSLPQPVENAPPAPGKEDKVQYGRYLVTLAGCGDCHTPLDSGQPVESKRFGGGQAFPSRIGTVVSANISPDRNTGIGKWSEDFFLQKFADYREYAVTGPPTATGPEQFTLMPWLRFAQLPDEDLRAIYAFLRTVKPVHQSVETHPGGQTQSAAR